MPGSFTSSAAAESLPRAQRFLRAGRSPDGLWRDFRTLAGPSCDWVTGFVAYALRQADPDDEVPLEALSLVVRRQRRDGGWSYNEKVPSDCDSTSWVLLASSTGPGCRPSVVDRALSYLARHQDGASGGFSTYAESDGIDAYIEAESATAVRGWTSPHGCVTAVTLETLLSYRDLVAAESIERAVQFVLRSRGAGGLWRSYWWTGHGYHTYHALKALSWAGAAPLSLRREVSSQLLAHQRDDGSWSARAGAEGEGEGEAFETAFSLLALLLCGGPPASPAAAASWLRERQNADGSWPVTPMLRIPPPMVRSPDGVGRWRINARGTGVVLEDPRRLFTTAAAVWALAVYRSMCG